jgi:hypothetical protein
VVNFTPRPVYPRGKKAALLIEQEDVWIFWRKEKSLVPPGESNPG